MKITIEKSQYDHTTENFKTTVLVFETNEVSLLEAYEMVNKELNIISINGKHDWRDRLFDGFVNPLDKVAPVIYPIVPPVTLEPGPYVFPTPAPNTIPGWTPMRPLIGDPPGWPNNPTVICSGKTSDQTGVVPFLSGMTVVEKPTQSAMTQADGEGDDSGLRAD